MPARRLLRVSQGRAYARGFAHAPTVLMVIFGAGASYDAAPNLSPAQRPPLADQLFDPRFGEVIDRYEECTGLVPLLRAPMRNSGRRRGQSLEDILEKLTLDAEKHQDSDRLIELAAVRFYLRDVAYTMQDAGGLVNGVTNYASLLSQILHRKRLKDAPVALVNFNYDTLQEDAVRRVFRLPLEAPLPEDHQLSRFIDGDPRILVFRPHGSWNWTRVVRDPPGTTVRELIHAAPTLKFEDRYLLNNDLAATVGPDYERIGQVMFPWLAVPLRTKTEFSWPKSHEQRFISLLPNVTHLIIIGWRGADTHFLRLIHEAGGVRLTSIHLITGSMETVEHLSRVLENYGIHWARGAEFPNGFSSYVDHLATAGIDDFLQM